MINRSFSHLRPLELFVENCSFHNSFHNVEHAILCEMQFNARCNFITSCIAGWTVVGGSLMQIDSGPKGVVCGVNKGMEIYCRFGITDKLATGSKWTKLSGSLKYISCGAYGYWGVSQSNEVYFTAAVSGATTQWTKIDGSLTQIEAGPKGEVWAVNGNKELYTRIGVSQSSPSGFKWKKVGTRSFSSVTIGLDKLYAVDVGYTVYMGSIMRQTSSGLWYNCCVSKRLKGHDNLNMLCSKIFMEQNISP